MEGKRKNESGKMKTKNRKQKTFSPTLSMFLRPELFCALAIIYFAAGALSAANPAITSFDKYVHVGEQSLYVWLFGLAFFFMGSAFMPRLFGRLAGWKKWLPLVPGVVIVSSMFSWMIGTGPFLAALISVALAVVFYMVFKHVNDEKRAGQLFVIGLLACLVGFAITGVPLLSGMHFQMQLALNPLYMFGMYSMLYALVRLHPCRPGLARVLFLVALLVAVLSSYRSMMAISFLTWVLVEAHEKGMGNGKKLAVAAAISSAAVLVLFAFVSVGYTNATAAGEWSLSPLQTIEYRLAFTNSIFDKIVGVSIPYGYGLGSTIFKPLGSLPAELFYGGQSNLTSAAFGELMLEGGLLAVALGMLFCGGFLGWLHKSNSPIYALMMAHMIVAIETGVNFFFLGLYFYIGYIAFMVEKENDKI